MKSRVGFCERLTPNCYCSSLVITVLYLIQLSSYKRFLHTRNDVITTLAWRATSRVSLSDRDLLVAFCSNCSSISHCSRVLSVFPYRKYVITVSGIMACPVDMELADSESACPVCYSLYRINIFLYLLPFRHYPLFSFKSAFAL